MTQTPCSYDDRIRPYPYDLTIPEAANFPSVGAIHEHLLPHTTPRLDATHTYHYFQPPDPSCAPYHNELNPPQLTPPPYSLFPAGGEPTGDAPTNYRNLSFAQPSEVCNPWGSFYPPRNLLPNATYGIPPPTPHHSTFDSTLYSDSHQSSWPAGNTQVTCVDGFLPAPSNYLTPVFPPHNSVPFRPQLDHTSEPYTGTLDASYPCQWTEGGVVCSVMVQATRSQMNRHLHACHGFGGSDSRQTKCFWAGCEETMQQGSIARHLVTCHLQAKVTCPMCSKKLSRQDVISKHQRVCPAASARH